MLKNILNLNSLPIKLLFLSYNQLFMPEPRYKLQNSALLRHRYNNLNNCLNTLIKHYFTTALEETCFTNYTTSSRTPTSIWPVWRLGRGTRWPCPPYTRTWKEISRKAGPVRPCTSATVSGKFDWKYNLIFSVRTA